MPALFDTYLAASSGDNECDGAKMSGQQFQVELSSKDDKSPSVWARRAFEKQLLNIIPDLRAFARFLTGNPSEADDFVQDTVVRALKSYEHFDLDTNMKAWTFTILRNIRINSFRKNRHEQLDEKVALNTPTHATQEHHVELRQVMRAMDKLSAPHREVIALVRCAGCSYEEAAEIMKCNIGTIKSRLNRADAALRQILGPEFQIEGGTRHRATVADSRADVP